jgi:hypothetical protein
MITVFIYFICSFGFVSIVYLINFYNDPIFLLIGFRLKSILNKFLYTLFFLLQEEAGKRLNSSLFEKISELAENDPEQVNVCA